MEVCAMQRNAALREQARGGAWGLTLAEGACAGRGSTCVGREGVRGALEDWTGRGTAMLGYEAQEV